MVSRVYYKRITCVYFIVPPRWNRIGMLTTNDRVTTRNDFLFPAKTDWHIFVWLLFINVGSACNCMRCVCVLSFFHLNQVTWRWHFDWLFFIYICAVSRAVIRFPYNAGVGCNWGGLFLLGRLFNTLLRCHMFAYALVLVHKFSVNFRSTDHRFLTKQHLIRYGQSAPFFRYFVISARIFSSFFFHFVRLLLSFHSIRVRFFHLTKRTYILFVSLGPLSSGAAVNKISSDKQEFPLP